MVALPVVAWLAGPEKAPLASFIVIVSEVLARTFASPLDQLVGKVMLPNVAVRPVTSIMASLFPVVWKL